MKSVCIVPACQTTSESAFAQGEYLVRCKVVSVTVNDGIGAFRVQSLNLPCGRLTAFDLDTKLCGDGSGKSAVGSD